MIQAPAVGRSVRAGRGALDHHQTIAVPRPKPVQNGLDRRRPRPVPTAAHQHTRLIRLPQPLPALCAHSGPCSGRLQAVLVPGSCGRTM